MKKNRLGEQEKKTSTLNRKEKTKTEEKKKKYLKVLFMTGSY
jgi:hypothetical protein